MGQRHGVGHGHGLALAVLNRDDFQQFFGIQVQGWEFAFAFDRVQKAQETQINMMIFHWVVRLFC